MMRLRSSICGLLSLFVVAPAIAQTPSADGLLKPDAAQLRIEPGANVFRANAHLYEERLQPYASPPLPSIGGQAVRLSVGPFTLDVESSQEDRERRPVQFAHVRLDDFRIFGGEISGTFDGRAMAVRLSWPAGQ